MTIKNGGELMREQVCKVRGGNMITNLGNYIKLMLVGTFFPKKLVSAKARRNTFLFLRRIDKAILIHRYFNGSLLYYTKLNKSEGIYLFDVNGEINRLNVDSEEVEKCIIACEASLRTWKLR